MALTDYEGEAQKMFPAIEGAKESLRAYDKGDMKAAPEALYHLKVVADLAADLMKEITPKVTRPAVKKATKKAAAKVKKVKAT